MKQNISSFVFYTKIAPSNSRLKSRVCDGKSSNYIMKKLFFIILAVMAAMFTTVSCNQTTDGIIDYDSRQTLSRLKLVELTFEGHTHQYVFSHSIYDTQLDHWPSCKYCEEPSTKTEETTPEKPVLRKIETLQRQQVELSTFQTNKNPQ